MLLLLLVLSVSAATPVADFSGTPVTGTLPLTVSFTDASSNIPAGWAWFFGDEDYSGAWTQQTAAAGWAARRFHSSAVLPDGKIVLTGGQDAGSLLSDTWMSSDKGATWTRMTDNWVAPARDYHSSVALPDGSIVVMGGEDTMGLALNDVLRSTDNGATWSTMADPASWPARYDHSSVAMPDGSIVLMGGDDGFWFNDVWRSTDNGVTWTQMTAAAGWTGRQGHTSVALQDGSIVMMGGRDGSYLNDVWRSTDNGAAWSQLTAAAGWTARYHHTCCAMPDGSIVLMGGYDGTLRNDVWRSTDNGATWSQLTAAAAWTARYRHTSVAMPDGSIVLMGGYDGALKNDVWRFQPAGSSLQNPSHTYTTAGTYPVSLQVNNNDGYDSTIKSGYITVTAPALPVADFSGTPTTGTGPLAVSFTDASTNTPTGWAWFFGDEDYSGTWTQQTPSAGWSERVGHATVVMPDGTIVLTGGIWGGGFSNETWKSVDKGVTWTTVNASSGWCPRQWHSTVVTPDGSIVLMGGEDAVGRRNDVWLSSDTGTSWKLVNANAAWSDRECHSTVALPDGSIVLTGGYDGISFTDDTWRSSDKGATWTLMNADSGWAERHNHATVVMPDTSILLFGGQDSTTAYRNDIWRSTDFGGTWTQITGGAAWSARERFGIVVLPDRSIVLMGGEDSTDRRCDIWRSIDYGATWSLENANADWSCRQGHRAAAMPDGSIVIMGGYDGALTNDVWRLQPAGSSLQNPSHTYTTVGSYNVSLQAYNNGGYNSIWKAGYITVTSAIIIAPVAGFTGTPTTGTAPLAVTFTDTSTNFPDAWNWSFGDGTFSSPQNPAHTYATAGTYTVILNATNAAGSNTSTRTGYITVTNPAPVPLPDTVSSGGSDSDSGGGAPSPPAEPQPEPEPQPAQQPEPGQQPQQEGQQLAPFEGGLGLSPEEMTPVEGLEGTSVAESYPIGYAGLDYNTRGDSMLSIDRETAEQAGAIVTVYFDRITSYQHSSPGVLITFWGDQFEVHNGLITGNVTRAEFITDPLIVNVSGGTVAGRVQAALTSINQKFEMENAITGIIPPETVVSYNTLLGKDNQSVAGVAYLMEFRRGSLTTTGAANVTLTVPPSWVTRHGGRDAVRIARTGDTDGRTELLATTFVGTDDAGNMVFSGDSPHGTSLFGLITSQATAAEKKAHPNVTYIPASKPAMATNIGMVAWIAALISDNPVIILLVFAVAGVIAYLGWWKRRL